MAFPVSVADTDAKVQVTGSLQTEGGRIRLVTRLVDTEDERQMWAETVNVSFSLSRTPGVESQLASLGPSNLGWRPMLPGDLINNY